MTEHALTEPMTWQLCEHCQSPLDARQRYCVVCGARSATADDPAARYLAEATRQSRTVVSTPVLRPARDNSTAVIGVLLALLPLGAGIGVLVGRGGGSDQAIIDALKAQRPPVVNVGAAGAGAAVDTTTAATGSETTATKAKSAEKGGKRLADGGKILTTGPAGSARQLEGAQVTKKQLQESAAAVKRINASKGKAYVESQRNLPDQIVIP